MYNYLELLQDVLNDGKPSTNRTGVDCLKIFGSQLRFDLQEGFPLLTTKRVFFRGVIEELLWFLRGEANIKYLKQRDIHIWDEWAEDGRVGRLYGFQWRRWCGDKKSYDQIENVIHRIKSDPTSRRLIVSAWNVDDIEEERAVLPPCHCLFQFDVSEGHLNCQVYQRSADLFLGVPFNIASYAALTHMVAQVCGLKPGELIWIGGNVHIYDNHIEQVKIQLDRKVGTLPNLALNPAIMDIDDFSFEDFILTDYFPCPSIPAPVAV
jgi:thymidylate synthase